MRKIIFILLVLVSNFSFSYYTAYAGLENGEIILSDKATHKRALASLTKVMTIAVILDAVDKGEITLNDLVKIEDRVNVGESSVPLVAGDRISVEELLKSALIYSANNAAYALAIYLCGSEDKFVEKMNRKALYLGMFDTTYYTSTGLPTSISKKKLDTSTAKDQYILARYIIKDKRVLKWADQKYVRVKGLYYKTRNTILGKNGNIGLKTGFNLSAGFNMIGLFKIYSNKLIVVTLGDLSPSQRANSQLKISENYKNTLFKIYSDETVFDNVVIKDSRENKIKTKLAKSFYYPKKGIDYKIILDKNIKGSVKIGQKIGIVEFFYKDKKITEIDLLADENTQTLSIWGKVKTWF